MEETPKDTSTLMLEIEQKLQAWVPALSQAADTIMVQDVSRYPIFVVADELVEVGIAMAEPDGDSPWHIRASTLEEFVARNLVENEKLEKFREVYKDPRSFICVFIVMTQVGATFAFLPRRPGA